MAIGDVIVSATDYNRSVQELADLHDTLYDLKKEFENINSVFIVDKETLKNKISTIENIFKKIELKQNNSASNLLEAVKTLEDYKSVADNQLALIKKESEKNIVFFRENLTKKREENLQKLIAINKKYIDVIQNLNDGLDERSLIMSKEVEILNDVGDKVFQEAKSLNLQFGKLKKWLWITSLAGVSIVSFFSGMFFKHYITINQLKALPTSTYQFILPYISNLF